MAYNFTSQLQGPQVSISLFGDAASAGINAGNALPTPLTAAIQGGIKGIQQGMNIAQEGQQIAINQNTIEQLPTENAIRQEQLEAQQLQNDIRQVERKVVVETQDAKLRLEKADLEKKAIEAENVAGTLKTQDEILKLLESNDPAERLKILQDKNFGKALINNPNLAENVIGRLYPDMNEEQRRDAFAALDFSKQRYYDEARARENDQYLERVAKLKDTSFWDARGDIELAPFMDQIGTDGSNIKVVPATRLDPDSKEVIPLPGMYEVFNGDKRLGELRGESAANKLQLFGAASKAHDTRLKDSINYKPVVKEPPASGGTASTIPTLQGKATPAPTSGPAAVEGATSVDRLKAKREQYRAQMQSQKQAQATAANEVTPSPATTPVPGTTPASSSPVKEQVAEAAITSGAQAGTQAAVQAPSKKKVALSPFVQNRSLLTKAVSLVENGKQDPEAVSPRGAKGLMQVMPETFKWLTTQFKALQGKNPNNPSDNVDVGEFYLDWIGKTYKYGFEPGNGLELTLASYNTGPGRVQDALRMAVANGDPTWGGVKKELKKMLNPEAYDQVSKYPDKVIRKLYNLLEA